MFKNVTIHQFDAELAQAMDNEAKRQEDHIELIASENYCSPAVMEAQGSQLTNKYAEGYPGKRYYGGCEYVDVVEQLAIDRAKELFGADYANVQPHAGSQANSAVFLALLKAGDTVLGMSLADGGHLTHGAHVNFSGINYKAVQYGLNKETGIIDYDEVERAGPGPGPECAARGRGPGTRSRSASGGGPPTRGRQKRRGPLRRCGWSRRPVRGALRWRRGASTSPPRSVPTGPSAAHHEASPRRPSARGARSA